ncbi:hypothetical protein GC177_02640 [bacterium]|nr:hypothetical protein [bacterium]
MKLVWHVTGKFPWEPALHPHFRTQEWDVTVLGGGIRALASAITTPPKGLHGICITDPIAALWPDEAIAAIKRLSGWLVRGGMLMIATPDAESLFAALGDPPVPVKIPNKAHPMELLYGEPGMPLHHAYHALGLGALLKHAGLKDIQLFVEPPFIWAAGTFSPLQTQVWSDKYRVTDPGKPHVGLGLMPDDLRLAPVMVPGSK